MSKAKLIIVAVALVSLFAFPAHAADYFGVADWPLYAVQDGPFHWARDELKLVVAAELMRGFPPEKPEMLFYFDGCGGVNVKVLGELRPGSTISRGEYATIVCRALDLESAPAATNPFADVKNSDWYAPSVLRLVRAGVISPPDYGKKFDPKGAITRKEIAVWMARAAESKGVKADPAPVTFADFSDKDKHALEVSKAVGLKIIGGYPDGTFRPNGSANRAEAAVMLARLIKLLPLYDGIDAERAKQLAQQVADAMYRFQKAWPVKIKATWERNPGYEAALAQFQKETKDILTEYQHWPRLRPDGYGPLNKLHPKNDTGPASTWVGLEGGYGLVEGMLLRCLPYGMPAEYMGKASFTEVVVFAGAGPVAEVGMNGTVEMKYIDGYTRTGYSDTGNCRAFLVKQGGKWKVAAMWASDEPWLPSVGFAKR